MSVWNFVKEAGERIVTQAKAAVRFGPAEPEAPEQKPTQTSASKGNGRDAGDAIANYIRAQNLDIADLKVSFEARDLDGPCLRRGEGSGDEGESHSVLRQHRGRRKSNVEDISVKETAPPAQYHTVVKGDTLSAIAKKYYGDASKYPRDLRGEQADAEASGQDLSWTVAAHPAAGLSRPRPPGAFSG